MVVYGLSGLIVLFGKRFWGSVYFFVWHVFIGFSLTIDTDCNEARESYLKVLVFRQQVVGFFGGPSCCRRLAFETFGNLGP